MGNRKIYSTLGIMSGTSMDGIDFSYIKTDGKDYVFKGAIEKKDGFIVARNKKLLNMVVKSLNIINTSNTNK